MARARSQGDPLVTLGVYLTLGYVGYQAYKAGVFQSATHTAANPTPAAPNAATGPSRAASIVADGSPNTGAVVVPAGVTLPVVANDGGVSNVTPATTAIAVVPPEYDWSSPAASYWTGSGTLADPFTQSYDAVYGPYPAAPGTDLNGNFDLGQTLGNWWSSITGAFGGPSTYTP